MVLDSAFWQSIKDQMKGRNSNNKLLSTWLDPIEYVETLTDSDRPKMKLGVPNALHQYFVVENLQDKILLEISETYRAPFDLEIVVTGPKSLGGRDQAIFQEDSTLTSTPPPARVTQASGIKEVRSLSHESLNPDHAFSTFVVGKNSEFAHAACYNVAKNPGAEDYNPLYIYGPVGMGKTHLLHAAGNFIREHFPHLKIIYISAERFMNECISALRHQQMEKFRQKFRENSDILLVDDVQYIGKGEATQEEFFHTINLLLNDVSKSF